MRRENINISSKAEAAILLLGENIRLARLRRKLSANQVSERAGISRSSLWKIEKGSSTVSIGNIAQVLFILGLEKELGEVAQNDNLGRKLQDLEISVKKRAPKRLKRDENE
ncbi:MAG TPA: helix-turn-helix transcriptional regulator [Bacteroidales bacterium]|nr:helix-turn-helix transcriptional regulator [Bacteroidales bacterium]